MEKRLDSCDWRKLIKDGAKLRGYSGKTIKAYTYYVGRFLGSGLKPKEFISG